MKTRAQTRFENNAPLCIQQTCLDKAYEAKALNYSEEGIAFETNHRFKVGTVIYIRKNVCSDRGACRSDGPLFRSSTFATVKWISENGIKSDSVYSVGVKNFPYGSVY